MKKKNNSTISPFTISKTLSRLEVFRQQKELFRPDRQDVIDEVKRVLLDWASEPTSETITQFCCENNINRRMFYYMMEQDQELRDIVEQVNIQIGDRGRHGALHRQIDKDVLFRYIHRLDPEWKEINKYHADLKNTEASTSDKIFIEIPHTTVETKANTDTKPLETGTPEGDTSHDETGSNESRTLTD